MTYFIYAKFNSIYKSLRKKLIINSFLFKVFYAIFMPYFMNFLWNFLSYLYALLYEFYDNLCNIFSFLVAKTIKLNLSEYENEYAVPYAAK